MRTATRLIERIARLQILPGDRLGNAGKRYCGITIDAPRTGNEPRAVNPRGIGNNAVVRLDSLQVHTLPSSCCFSIRARKRVDRHIATPLVGRAVTFGHCDRQAEHGRRQKLVAAGSHILSTPV